MTRKPAAFLMTALATAVTAALAQEAPPFEGSVSVTGISTHVTSQNRFRFEEYRDLDSGATAGLSLRGQSGDWWYNVFGENLGRDDQFAQVRGGRFGVFKYSVYADDIIHNLTFGAITPFSGVGTNNLTFAAVPVSTNTATWTPFDYSVKHENVGAFAEAQLTYDSPYYARVAANRKKSDGIKPLGAPGTSPGGPAYELPNPIDWTTTDVSGEIGYSTKTAHLSVSVLWSKFEDNNDFLNWRHPLITSGANVESSTIAADNNLKRVAVNGTWKQLPWDSSLSVRGTYTKLTNSLPVGTTFIALTGTTGAARLANPNVSTFEGEVVNKSLSVAFNSRLAQGLESKVYANWYKRDNESTQLVFTPGGPGSGGTCDLVPVVGTTVTTCSNEPFHFKKDNAGVELYYRFNRQTKLTGGVDYTKIERERADFDRTREMKTFVELKSGNWDFADMRVKYIHTQRRSDFLEGSNPDIFERFLLRFDAAPLDRDQLKVVFDASPMPLLDVGAEFIYKRNDYKDSTLGRNNDKRREVALSASYGDPKAMRITAFADYEHTDYDSTHWVGATTTFPVTNPAGTTYLWTSQVKDKNYLVGVAADWFFSERLKFKASFIWQKADGAVDFAAASAAASPMNITNYDNFKKKALNVRATYAATKHIELALGAAYEKYDYTDIQMDDYIYAVRTGTNQNLLSGAYAFPNYKASIVYTTLTYRF